MYSIYQIPQKKDYSTYNSFFFSSSYSSYSSKTIPTKGKSGMDACRLGILYGFNNATEGVSIYFLDENVNIPGKRIYQDKDDNIKVYDTIPAKSIQSSSFRNLDEDIFPKLDNRCISYEIKKTFIGFPQNLC